jgi:polyhydroxyalkanoate synthesis regulator phasin
MGTWLSVLSWTHWRLTRTRRERLQEETLRQLLLLQLEQQELLQRLVHSQVDLMVALGRLPREEPRPLLLEALQPLAQALLRQDSLAERHQQETQEMLREVLDSLQPTASDQIFQRIGPPAPKIFSPGSAS